MPKTLETETSTFGGECEQCFLPEPSRSVSKLPVIGAGTIFRFGEQKLVKTIKTNSKYNFIQYVFFQKRYTQCTIGSDAKPQKVENFRECFC